MVNGKNEDPTRLFLMHRQHLAPRCGPASPPPSAAERRGEAVLVPVAQAVTRMVSPESP